MMTHISSHGYVVLAPFVFIGLPQNQYEAEWMIRVEEWAQQNLHYKMTNDGKKDTYSIKINRPGYNMV